MPKRKKRANWPYRWALLSIAFTLLAYLGLQTAIGANISIRRVGHIDWSLPLVAACLDATLAVWFVAVGACVGSFLNVVAYRLPIGRTVGGHSGCPYCQVPIESRDNVPVLGWIKLRGRCRSCRLPISAQYPLVEFTVAIAFLLVYLTEFRIGGANLPGVDPRFARGAYGIKVTPIMILSTVSYLVCVSGLIGAALIAIKKKAVPLKLYLWSVAPLTVTCLIFPEIIAIPWREALSPGPLGPIELRMDAFTTLLCGLVGGIALGRMLTPLLHPNFDRTFISRDSETNAARNFVGASGVAGIVLGWQSMIGFAWVLLLTAIMATLIVRSTLNRSRNAKVPTETQSAPGFDAVVDLTVWAWLGLLIFRTLWGSLDQFQVLPSWIPMVFRNLIALIAAAPLARIYAGLNQQVVGPKVARTPQMDEEFDDSGDPDD